MSRRRILLVLFILSLFICVDRSEADLSYTVSSSSWPNSAHRTAAVNAIQAVTDRYNAYGYFGDYNIWVYYNEGIQTAQASCQGSIGFGGTYPNEGVMQHEIAHYLCLPSGSWSSLMSGGVWSGPMADQKVRQFEGEEAELNGDSIHFWPYGLNYSHEYTGINMQRQVAIVYAMRADLGIGPSEHPSNATSVFATADDPFGRSGFNYIDNWSDGYFPHEGADYFTGDFVIRTPASENSFTFYGDSLTVNNTNDENGGLWYKGQGTNAAITIDNLILDGGWIQHQSTIDDVFELDGNIEFVSDSTIRANHGNIEITATIAGTGTLTIEETEAPSEDDRYVIFFSPDNSFTGDIVNLSRFKLASGCPFTFVIGASGINNAILGDTAHETQLDGFFQLDLSGASANFGDSWALVTGTNITYGRRFSIADFNYQDGIWSNGVYAFDESTGLLTVLPPPTTWDVNGDGYWSVASNWTDGVPATNDDAILGTILTAPAEITLDDPAQLNRLTFDNANSYTLGGANSLTLTGDAELVVHQGVHEVAVEVSGTDGLTKHGEGTISLSAVNTYSGDTTIETGTLALLDAGTISNTTAITISEEGILDVSAVESGSYSFDNQTVTVNGHVQGNITIENGSTVAINSSTDGNMLVRSESRVEGAGQINGDFYSQGGTIRVGEQGLTIEPIGTIVDDFESYALGDVRDVASPPWTAHSDTDKADIEDNNVDTQVLTFGSSSYQGVSRSIPVDSQIGNSEIATFFFRLNSKTTAPDHCFGLADDVTTSGAVYGNYEVQIRVLDNPSTTRTFLLDARNGSGFSPTLSSSLRQNTWYNIWVVVDQTADTYDIYLTTGTSDATSTNKLNGTPLAFRNGTTQTLDKILGIGIASVDNSVRYDDITILEGEDLRNPLSAFSEDNSEILTVDGDFTMSSSSQLEIDIYNSIVLDRLDVSGEFQASGVLEVTFHPDAEMPEPGDSFDIIDAGTFSGSFDDVYAPELESGHVWDLRELNTSGVLSVLDAHAYLEDCTTCLTGPGGGILSGCTEYDLDNDHDVDLFDYAVSQACVTNASGLLLSDCLQE